MGGDSLRRFWIASLVLAGAVSTSPGVSAMNLQCLQRTAVIERLEAASGERPAHAGLASNGALLEVTVSPDGSWTILLSFPDGLSCPLAAGEAWRSAPDGRSVEPAA